MSHSDNKVRWCLNKAKKEIQEFQKLGKRVKHRGLVEIPKNKTEAIRHINKAEHNLKAITDFKKIGYSDWSITAAFYSLYHCFLAIGLSFGYESRNQQCTIALIGYLKEENKINVDEKFIRFLKDEDVEERHENSVIEMREQYTYGVQVSIQNEEKLKDIIKDCKELVDITKGIVYRE